MYICYGNWTCFEDRQASSKSGDAFGVKRMFDFYCCSVVKLNALFFPFMLCECVYARAQVCRFQF